MSTTTMEVSQIAVIYINTITYMAAYFGGVPNHTAYSLYTAGHINSITNISVNCVKYKSNKHHEMVYYHQFTIITSLFNVVDR